MKLLDRYLMSTVIKLTLLVLLLMSGLEIFVNLLGEVGDIGQGNYGFASALEYVILSLPSSLYQLFPMIGLLGVLMGLGVLGSHHELLMMRAAGMSIAAMTRVVFLAALMVMCGAIIVGEGIAPPCLHLATTEKWMAESGGSVRHTVSGLWLHRDNAYIHVDTVTPNSKLYGITEYQFNDQHQLVAAWYAASAEKQQDAWELHQVKRSTFYADHVVVDQLPTLIWENSLNLRWLKAADVQSAEMNVFALHRYVRDEAKNGLTASAFELVFWQRLFLPFSSLVMMLLAIPFIFGPLREVSMGVRMVSGVAVGFCFYLLNQFFGPISLVYQFSPILAALLPTLVFAGVGGLLMWRVR